MPVPSASEQPSTPPGAVPYAVSFSADGLRQLRHAVADWAAQAGLQGQRAADFVIAVHEIATNAIRHGSPVARLALQITGTSAQAEVRDSGHWPLEPPAATLPAGSGWAYRWHAGSAIRSPSAAAPTAAQSSCR